MTRFLPQVFAPIVTRQLPSEINPPPTAHPVANSSEYMITEASGNKHYSVTVSDGLGVTLSLYAYDADFTPVTETGDRKSTRLNSSHRTISYAVFCLKKKKNT